MTAKDLLKPRYEIVSDAPLLKNKVGEIIAIKDKSGRIECDFFFAGKALISPDSYPLIFRKLNWWERRKEEDMPKRLICKAIPNDKEVIEIEEWDMEILVGWRNKERRECASLLSFNPEYGYFPVD